VKGNEILKSNLQRVGPDSDLFLPSTEALGTSKPSTNTKNVAANSVAVAYTVSGIEVVYFEGIGPRCEILPPCMFT
jgi:hypothetical protein